MALLIATATRRELERLRDDGWTVGELSPAEFRRFFLRDPGPLEPGVVVGFLSLNHTLGEIAAALGGGTSTAPQTLRLVGAAEPPSGVRPAVPPPGSKPARTNGDHP